MDGFAVDIVEEQILSCETQPKIHQHYVDDCFDIVKNKSQGRILLKSLKSFNSELLFMHETENKVSLSFLDVQFSRMGNRFSASCNMKAINMGLYKLFSSYCDPWYKEVVPRELFQRAFTISTDYYAVTAALDRFFDVLCKNRHPDDLLGRMSESVICTGKQTKHKDISDNFDKKKCLEVTFYRYYPPFDNIKNPGT